MQHFLLVSFVFVLFYCIVLSFNSDHETKGFIKQYVRTRKSLKLKGESIKEKGIKLDN